MDRVFGFPAGPLAVTLVVLLLVAVTTIGILAVRNFVFFKMGVRNIPRRRARSALIVTGLMLGTAIIASALLTGDTMSSAIKGSVVRSLGQTDVAVVAGGRSIVAGDLGVASAQAYFDHEPALVAIEDATATAPVDGVAGAIIEPIAAQSQSRGRTAPRLSLFAPDPQRAEAFGFGMLTDLADGEALLDDKAAGELDAEVGDLIQVLVGDRVASLTVTGTGRYDGSGSDQGSVIVPLPAAQELLGRPGQVNHVLVSNTGGTTSGVAHTAEVVAALEAPVAELGLAVEPLKRDGLDVAAAAGAAFVTLFTTFGSFSMAAGVLLIFLIFVMLAGERRAEMGMARAVGTQRRHLVQTFLFEGSAYDLAAAAVGALLGIGVSFAMVVGVARAFAGSDLELTFSMTWRSLAIAYALGALLTFVVVTASAWRVSRLNIVSAIRDLPEAAEPPRRRIRWLQALLLVVPGLLIAVPGANSQVYVAWMLGLSLLILALVPVIRMVGGGHRLAFSAAGGLLVLVWLLPMSFFDRFFGAMAMDFSVWVVGGLMVVIAATWVITFNADVLLGIASWATSPSRRLRPIVRMAIAYPLRNRFRTGVTMAMFMLVVFTLVTGTVIPKAFTDAFDDVESFGGGYDVRVSTAPVAAVDDLRAQLPAEVSEDVVDAGAQSFIPLDVKQDGTSRDFELYPVRGLDAAFLDRTTYGFAALGTGYGSAAEVWAAVANDPTLAVVDAFVAPRRAQWGFGVPPDFQLSGFYIDDGTFDPVTVTVRDPLTSDELHLTVVGVLSDDLPWEMAGISVSQDALTGFGDRAIPTVHHLAVREGVDPDAVAAEVEAALLARGAEAVSYRELLDDAVGASMLMIRLIQGFMGLGLVVGVAALGVISARSVVERRQQVGMLRAIGYQPEAIRWTLLAESSIISLTSIVVGTALGLVISYNVIADSNDQPAWSDVAFSVPWLNLALIFGAVYAAALLTTYLPARRASRIYPAEALRYQ